MIGRWSDFIGRRAALLVLGIMGAGTILCIAAPTLPLLVAGRFLRGFPAPCSRSPTSCSARTECGTSVGIIAAINGGIGGADGYVAGSAEIIGFRSIFLVVLVLTTVAARWSSAWSPAGIRGAMDWWGFTPRVWRAPARTTSKGTDGSDADAGKVCPR